MQRHYHNFKQFRIFDLSDHKMNSQHLIVSVQSLQGRHVCSLCALQLALAVLPNPLPLPDLLAPARTRGHMPCPPISTPPQPSPVYVEPLIATSLPYPCLLARLQGHPMALHRLAAFFQDQYYQAKGHRKPVMLIGPRTAEGRCLVIGYEATQRMRVSRPAGLAS